MATLVFFCISSFFSFTNAATFSSIIDLSNVTNPAVSKYIFGMNMYQSYGENEEYTGNYTLGRFGGNAQTRFNYKINAQNSGADYYFITQASDFTWQEFYMQASANGLSFWTQIPAMGWVASSTTKSWSFSEAKYGQQKANECSNYPDGTTWCAKDAGNGVWANGSNVVGNDPFDASVQISVSDTIGYVEAVMASYPNNAIFSIDNEPTLWSSNHRDVHPEGATYDEIVNLTLTHGAAVKQTCNGNCLVAGYSPWGWCGYFEDGYDHDLGFCTNGGPDYIAKGNVPLNEYYLEQLAAYEKENSKRILDIMDVHYYPAATGTSMDCDESDPQKIKNRLSAVRSLYDYGYVDPSWINTEIALIPRYKNLINRTYPGTKFSISEYNFGGDDCITSVIAHSEALAVFATYGVYAATRWSKPAAHAPVTNAFNIFTNYDGRGSNIFDAVAFDVKDENVDIVSSYAFLSADKSKIFFIAYNKDQNNENSVNVAFTNNGNNFQINGDLSVYGVDKSGMGYVGSVTPGSSASFVLSLPAWSIRLAVGNLVQN